MKIIDLLNKMSEGTLEHGFKFIYRGRTYTYNKNIDEIIDESNIDLRTRLYLEICLNDDIEVIEENKEIKELENEIIGDDWTRYAIMHHNKINELVREINKIKESK